MPLTKEPDTEPIPGYRLIEPLGQGGFGEVWKCEAPGGLFKAIKFVHGSHSVLADERLLVEQEWAALQRIKAIRHPFLLGTDRVEVIDGDLIVVMELADRSLLDVFRECRQAGLPGIPREELLAYLREAAEALDVINLQHGLQHLDIKPANLFVVNHHVKVGDFGLVSCLTEGGGAGDIRGGLTPMYCAPETLQGRVDSRSDQYSLAVVYQEMLTGRLPFPGQNAREVLLRRATGEPDLSPLPEADQPVVRRALARDPEQRFPSCTEFVRALAPELMPPRSSPFLDVLLNDGPMRGGDSCVGRSGTRPVLTHPTERLAHLNRPRSKPDSQPPAPETATSDYVGFGRFRFLRCLSRGQLCETWKVQAPDGSIRLLKFPCGLADASDPAEAEAVRFLTSLSHPRLLAVEVVVGETGRRALLCDLVEGSLGDRLHHCQTLGLPGIPRRELLDHLQAAADVLDTLYHKHHVQHLCLNPRSLVLQDGRLLVADLGLAQLLWLPAGQPVGQLNGRYAPPELIAGEVHPTADQYSLAVLFQEMLTGTSPFRGSPSRGKARPNLEMLPAPDRAAIARALNPNPEKRFATCRELIEALEQGDRTRSERTRAAVLLPPVIAAPVVGPATGPAAASPLPTAGEVIAALFNYAAGQLEVRRSDALFYAVHPGNLLRHTCGARLSPALARLKLEGFCLQWNAETLHDNGSTFLLQVPLAGTFWQRCFGKEPALEIQLLLVPPPPGAAGLTEVRIEIRPVRCRPDQAAALLTQQAPQLLHSLRTFLNVEPERRLVSRLSFPHPLGAFPVFGDGELGDPIVCHGKDVSLSGIGFYCAGAPPSPRLYLQSLVIPQWTRVALLGKVVRTRRCDNGRHEVGVLFLQEPESWLPPDA